MLEKVYEAFLDCPVEIQQNRHKFATWAKGICNQYASCRLDHEENGIPITEYLFADGQLLIIRDDKEQSA